MDTYKNLMNGKMNNMMMIYLEFVT